jgi:hypothetical protein
MKCPEKRGFFELKARENNQLNQLFKIALSNGLERRKV